VKTTLRAVLAVATAAGIALSLPASAHAERVVHHDARGDLTYSWYDAETGESGTEPAPGAQTGDVTRTAVRHRTSNVFILVTFADLRRDDASSGHFLRVVTNEGARRNVMIDVSAQQPQGVMSMYKDNGARLTCRGLGRHIDYSDETIRFEVPRSCLGSPRWVRVGFNTFRYPDSTSYNGFLDDANQVQDVGGDHPALGSRVSRN
jgi:hypothetical protein